MSKIFKAADVPSEKIGKLRRLARDGRPVEEAVDLLGYRGKPENLVAMARITWNIRFETATQRKSGHRELLRR